MVELREFHRTNQLVQDLKTTLKEGEVVTMYDENQHRGLWRLGRIVSTIDRRDRNVRGARVQVLSKKGQTMITQCPIQNV